MPDVERSDLQELNWTAQHRTESLSRVFAHVVGLATAAERWYAQGRRSKRFWGQWLRVSAIVLGGVAVILPIIAQIYSNGGKPAIAPGWASVAIAGAVTLVALDRFYGFSAAWMRFMTAELRITRIRHEFEYSWESLLAACASPPSERDVAELLARAREFALEIDDAVADETSGWTTEFRTSLDRAENRLDSSARG